MVTIQHRLKKIRQATVSHLPNCAAILLINVYQILRSRSCRGSYGRHKHIQIVTRGFYL
jgi:hypothetical protein